MPDISLSLRNITKSYDGRTTVLEIDQLDIEKGEFVSFLGPSGSGKTTTLMVVGGFEAPTSGDVVLGGVSIADVPAHRRNMGIVFQNYALFPHMNVLKNVQYPLKMRRFTATDIRQRVERALEMVGLTGFETRFPRELSGGQQQRVALARALVYEPDLVLLDEPFGALDKNLREQMQIELKRIHQQFGVTMIFVTHDQSEAMVMSDRIVVFNEGKVEQVGTPEEIYNRPTTAFVAEFIGDNNMLGVTAAGKQVAIEGIGKRNLSASDASKALVRPENIEVLNAGAPKARSEQKLRITEKLNYGDTAVLIGTTGDTSLRIKKASQKVADVGIGDELRILVPDEAIHFIRR